MNDALAYNENKVSKGQARLIMAYRFAANVEELSFGEKLRRFTLLNDRAPNISNNTAHIFLSFHSNEKSLLTDERLASIAQSYMEQIGFGGQPYLVYTHTDTANPHLHIVTTPILVTGRTINCHNIGKRLSAPARKQIEAAFHLIPAEKSRQLAPEELKPLNFRYQYGKTPTMQEISKRVRYVLSAYRFTSLQEFNAVLRIHGIMAFTGNHGSRQALAGGLTYHAIDESGCKIGVPVAASNIATSPTLPHILKQCAKNAVTASRRNQRLVSKINEILDTHRPPQEIAAAFRAAKIYAVSDSKTAETFFIDGQNNAVIPATNIATQSNRENKPHHRFLDHRLPDQSSTTATLTYTILDELLRPTATVDQYAQFQKKKKKRQKGR
ncbi:relaxase/mobilization nuclease domain-containing protein [Chitinophaga lutea]|nr:relaxase/mobilization nuclease domain-containing protein [Chitinophaga lutea]